MGPNEDQKDHVQPTKVKIFDTFEGAEVGRDLRNSMLRSEHGEAGVHATTHITQLYSTSSLKASDCTKRRMNLV